MSHTPHEIADDFPEFAEKIHELKINNTHFARLMEEYHDLNRKIHRAETNVEPLEELYEGEIRKKRADLKDQIYHVLRGGA
ncbi:YdcH family protein [Pseudogemmobacter sp. W21_MBD1_M6]|uniref:YdcH family protein n=1 Tax=Pseudogemmobacter sp. W21_MBD1_M6 TaxID=3240271 RepID=UPI003F9EAE95